MPASVLLLRSPAEDGPDKYEEAFRARGYRPISVPVLETVHKNLDALAEVVRDGGAIGGEDADARYAGVIVTSGRACEAWQAVVQRLANEPSNARIELEDTEPDWLTIPFYVVGSTTASALFAIHAAFPSSPYTPRDIRGAESGTAEKLAHFILSDLPEEGRRRLLYLTGDKNRDTLPKILGEGGLYLESLQVYATQGSSRFEEDFQDALRAGASAADTLEDWWVVHFAPSAANAVSPTLAKYFDIPAAQSVSRRRARIAAIGPTTSAFLHEELHIEVAVVAERPTPESLAEGIAEWDRTHELEADVGKL